MRRGLLTWNPEELPLPILEARVAKLRAGMQAQGLDAFVAYTNISHPAVVSWASGFTPYWSEGLLYVPRDGEIAFATALSKRVAEWISTVMPRGEIIPTPQPGVALSKKLAATGAKKIGIPDLDDMPARQGKDLQSQIPDLAIVDATALFNTARRIVDDAERAMVRRAALIANEALAQANAAAATAQELIAPCEGNARRAAAEEIFVSVIEDLGSGGRYQRTDTAGRLGETFALRLSLAYKAGWVRLARSYARDAALATRFATVQTLLETISAAEVGDGTRLGEILTTAGATLRSWSVEQPRGSSPLVPVAGTMMQQDDWERSAPATLSVECDIEGHRWVSALPLLS